MTTFSRAQFAFSAGEVSPLLHRRPDYQRSQTGLAAANGFLPLRQGGFTRAPGTTFHGTTRENAAARLLSFEFAANDAMELEFSPGKLRFWRYGALVMKDGAPYEIDTPYGADSIDQLSWQQSADVIYIVDGLQPMQRLSRFAVDDWTIAAQVIEKGPFRIQNLDKDKRISTSDTTGEEDTTVTLTASWDFFEANHLGSLLQLKVENQSKIMIWSAGSDGGSTGDYVRHDGRTYQLASGSEMGLVAPTHEEGTLLYDDQSGPGARRWKYIDDGTGVVEITAITSPTVAQGIVRKRLPAAFEEDDTYRWAEGAWNERYGYPAAICLYDDRLVGAATQTDPRTLWFSTVGDYASFDPGVDDDDSFAFSIGGQATQNQVLWLCPGRNALHVGALGEENSSTSTDTTKVIGPTTTRFRFDSQIGSHPVRPIAPEGTPIFISKDKGRVFQIVYSLDTDANRASELSLPADHLGAAGFEDMIWQSAPQRTAWLRRGDGTLAAMLYDAAEDVLGWAPLSVAGGFVESFCVTPSADSTADIITLIVRREIDGQTLRCVERMAVNHPHLAGAMPFWEVNHAFCALRFEPEAEATTFTLPHLPATPVRAWTEKGEFGPLTTDAGGTVTLPLAVAHAIIGLHDATHYAETLDIQSAANDGETMGRRKKLHSGTTIGLHRTAQAIARTIERELGQEDRLGSPAALVPVAVAGSLNRVVSGLASAPTPSGATRDVALRLEPHGLAPMTVTAIVAPVQDNGR